MPRDMFVELVSADSKSRRWYTLPASLFLHSTVAGVCVVVPLMATNDLPVPRTTLQFAAMTTVVPVPPPIVPPRAGVPHRAASPGPAPVVAPDQVAQPTGIVSVPEAPSLAAGAGLESIFGAVAAGAEQLPHAEAPVVSADTLPMRPGGALKPPVRTKHVLPEYPAIALASKREGVVIIEAIIGVDGKVTNARVLRSVPFLDQAALDAVRAWEYTPTLLNGQPTPVIVTVTIEFTLR